MKEPLGEVRKESDEKPTKGKQRQVSPLDLDKWKLNCENEPRRRVRRCWCKEWKRYEEAALVRVH